MHPQHADRILIFRLEFLRALLAAGLPRGLDADLRLPGEGFHEEFDPLLLSHLQPSRSPGGPVRLFGAIEDSRHLSRVVAPTIRVDATELRIHHNAVEAPAGVEDGARYPGLEVRDNRRTRGL